MMKAPEARGVPLGGGVPKLPSLEHLAHEAPKQTRLKPITQPGAPKHVAEKFGGDRWLRNFVHKHNLRVFGASKPIAGPPAVQPTARPLVSAINALSAPLPPALSTSLPSAPGAQAVPPTPGSGLFG